MSNADRLFTFLMVDDDPDDRMLFKEACDEVRLRNPVEFLENGEQLVDYLNRKGPYAALTDQPLPGIILLDLNMPLKDGREALEEIKASAELRHIPVIVLTTSKNEDDILSSYGLGASSYIVKPVSLDRLMRVVNSIGEYWVQIVEVPDGGAAVELSDID
ncbi:response regulator [Maricaulis salignorans]|uniref:Response regulator receiver domain-containing protein n=1 Tax=Maricaulis salignorans TaxID=144026 RepID=A0A1G9MS37_9PROT|nr:response regulator [Maricaulis salignorans]SDL76465.1 Response regulator receiver domain-containing protein [Maricaulis salignorans]